MEPGHLEILAEDPNRTQKFYCDVLGFELTTIQGGQFIWLKKGQMEILIRPGQKQDTASRYEDAAVGFVIYTDDIEESLKQLRGKGVEIRGMVDSNKCYSFTDPNGNWFQLVDPNDH